MAGAFFSTECVLTVIISVLASVGLLWHYTKSNYAAIRPVCTLPILLFSFLITLSPVGLLVLDIDWSQRARGWASVQASNSSALTGSPTGAASELYNPGVMVVWKVLFWCTQLLSWVVLPILQEYCVSGDFTVRGRVVTAIKENLKLYLVMGAVLGTLLLYLAFVSKEGITLANCVGIAVAASNAFGLLLIILFLGYGLAQLPRSLWYHSTLGNTLALLRWDAPALREQLDLNKMKWEDLRATVEQGVQTVQGTDDDELMACMERIVQLVNSEGVTSPRTHERNQRRRKRRAEMGEGSDEEGSASGKHDLTTKKGLVKLHARAIRIKAALETTTYEWDKLLDTAASIDSMQRVISTDAPELSVGNLPAVYNVYLRRYVKRLLAVLAGVGSLLLVWSFGVAVPLGSFSLVRYLVLKTVPSVQYLSVLLLMPYAAATCYWGLFRFKLFEFALLVPHHSSPYNLCFTATFLCRLVLPLCYVFLNICGLTADPSVAYTKAVIENLNAVTLLGAAFNKFMPCLLLLVFLAAATDAAPRLLISCGLEMFAFSHHSDPERIQEGKELINAENSVEGRRRRGGGDERRSPAEELA
eukprot:TRINITY_DN3269_c1_g1_i2.p1 TRINITY_DN3269_c1_g1~~TRINITY_DN3269_c1_g1_i2.p1  ORF type:complete len:587 (+),score=222.68 TRINITY_DN3269_c1_g1_i2:131-1891(+)